MKEDIRNWRWWLRLVVGVVINLFFWILFLVMERKFGWQLSELLRYALLFLVVLIGTGIAQGTIPLKRK